MTPTRSPGHQSPQVRGGLGGLGPANLSVPCNAEVVSETLRPFPPGHHPEALEEVDVAHILAGRAWVAVVSSISSTSWSLSPFIPNEGLGRLRPDGLPKSPSESSGISPRCESPFLSHWTE